MAERRTFCPRSEKLGTCDTTPTAAARIGVHAKCKQFDIRGSVELTQKLSWLGFALPRRPSPGLADPSRQLRLLQIRNNPLLEIQN
jgi:hypothetical protein